MSTNTKTMQNEIDQKKKTEQKSLIDIAKETQDNVRKILPLGAHNKNLTLLENLKKKLKPIFGKSFPVCKEVHAFTASINSHTSAVDVKKNLDFVKGFLDLAMRKFLKEVALANITLTKEEQAILPAYCAEILRNIFFSNERSLVSGINGMKEQANVASVVGAGVCGVTAAVGFFEVLGKYGMRADLYPIALLTIMSSKNLNDTRNGHQLLLLNADTKTMWTPKSKTVFCDFWADEVSMGLSDIVKKLPEPLPTFVQKGNMMVTPILDELISQQDMAILMNAKNPYETLRVPFHYAISDMYQLLTKETFSKEKRLIDESQHPRDGDDLYAPYQTTLNESELGKLREIYENAISVLTENLESEKGKTTEKKEGHTQATTTKSEDPQKMLLKMFQMMQLASASGQQDTAPKTKKAGKKK